MTRREAEQIVRTARAEYGLAARIVREPGCRYAVAVPAESNIPDLWYFIRDFHPMHSEITGMLAAIPPVTFHRLSDLKSDDGDTSTSCVSPRDHLSE